MKTIPLINRTVIALMLLLAVVPVLAQEPLKFDTMEQELRFNALTLELRCAVCQNQNLADSDAPLAHDLRQEIHQMLVAGKTDDEIKSFMVARYGDFVLYRPPVKKNTIALWIMPAVILFLGAIGVFVTVRKRSKMQGSN